jgi:hypothetical protein
VLRTLLAFAQVILLLHVACEGEDQHASEPIPAEIVARAQAYIASKVGPRYATANYEFVEEESSSHHFEGGVEYMLQFRFLPAERLGAPDARIFVRMFSDPEFVPYDWVAEVDESGKVAEPVVTRVRAVEIAAALGIPHFEAKGVLAVLRRPSHLTGEPWLRGWTWELRVPQPQREPGCFEHHLAIVNAVTGEAKALSRVRDCPCVPDA